MSNCVIDPLLTYNTGEAWFCLNDHVNIQYNRHWSVYDHRLMHGVPLPYVTFGVWCAVSATRIIGTLSFSKRWGEGLRIVPRRWCNRPYSFQCNVCLTEILGEQISHLFGLLVRPIWPHVTITYMEVRKTMHSKATHAHRTNLKESWGMQIRQFLYKQIKQYLVHCSPGFKHACLRLEGGQIHHPPKHAVM
jgi:hypothetical protein